MPTLDSQKQRRVPRYRTWKNRTDKFIAEYVDLSPIDSTVQLRLPDGTLVSVPLEDVSRNGIMYILKTCQHHFSSKQGYNELLNKELSQRVDAMCSICGIKWATKQMMKLSRSDNYVCYECDRLGSDVHNDGSVEDDIGDFINITNLVSLPLRTWKNMAGTRMINAKFWGLGTVSHRVTLLDEKKQKHTFEIFEMCHEDISYLQTILQNLLAPTQQDLLRSIVDYRQRCKCFYCEFSPKETTYQEGTELVQDSAKSEINRISYRPWNRIWRTLSGTFDATFENLTSEEVVLRTSRNNVINIPIRQLSRNGLYYVAKSRSILLSDEQKRMFQHELENRDERQCNVCSYDWATYQMYPLNSVAFVCFRCDFQLFRDKSIGAVSKNMNIIKQILDQQSRKITPRNWTNRLGEIITDGEFLAFGVVSHKIVILKPNGTTTPIDLSDLTGDDIIFIQRNQGLSKWQNDILQKDLDRRHECECCYSECLESEMILCEANRDPHRFCCDCARRTAEQLMVEDKTEFKCMSIDGCEAVFSLDSAKIFLNKRVFERLMRLLNPVEEEVEVFKFVDCPFCPWGAMLSDNEESLTCGNINCGRRSCRQCKNISHPNLTCQDAIEQAAINAERAAAEAQRAMAEAAQARAAAASARDAVVRSRHEARAKEASARAAEALSRAKAVDERIMRQREEAMSRALIRVCQKCSTPIIKSDGCNKVICTKCGQAMCYLCRRAISGYDHFGESLGKCRLIDETPLDEIHRREVEVADRQFMNQHHFNT
ncbi:16738_t:CDS:10 [Acaulospora morrowiae]|uniref:16738_t:CDS:1 n=1 Tax=Acaulospora morrowiae TaxID=94023 RepID=A0A9N8YWZ8_9GLOM|nr:16738_t:CDS:10 [Acaulospora morrowiae]